MRELTAVQPNVWNPNRLTERTFESLKHGFQTDGWISSQALLIWGKDDKGVQRDVIIDGEHRWKVATELGYTVGPMVVLDGLTEAQAKALTVKMDARRGVFDPETLGVLLREIQFEVGNASLGLELGLEDDVMLKLLAEPAELLPIPAPAPGFGSDIPEEAQGAPPPIANIRLVQLFFDDKGHDEFRAMLKEAAKRFGTKNETETVQEAVRRALAAPVSG